MDMPREDKSELYLNALDYAKEHNLDINKAEDVLQIAKAVDPEHTSKEEVEELIYQLKNATFFLTMTSKKEE